MLAGGRGPREGGFRHRPVHPGGACRWAVRRGAMAGDIIGRRDELLALETFLDNAATGGQALLLEGDAGIGKPVLWEEPLGDAAMLCFRVLRARPNQADAQIA